MQPSPKLYRTAVDGGLKLSPLWGDEAAVFNPASTEIFVVTELAARVLAAVQRHTLPTSATDLIADLETEPRSRASGALPDEIEWMLVELERLGFVESPLP